MSPLKKHFDSPEVTHVITEFIAVFSEDLSDKLPPTRDIQHAIELVQELVFPTCHTIRLTMSSILNLKSKLMSCH